MGLKDRYDVVLVDASLLTVTTRARIERLGVRVHCADLAAREDVHRHDQERLFEALSEVW